jgi:hypothetical protein
MAAWPATAKGGEMQATSEIAGAAAVDAPRREVAELDGPRGWPLVGNTLQLERSQAHRVVEGWARRSTCRAT